MRRRLLLIFVGLSMLLALLITWSQTRTVRVRPGVVRFTLVSPLGGDPVPGFATVDDEDPERGEFPVAEGEHQLTVFLMRDEPDFDSAAFTRSLRAAGPAADEVQDVTIRVWPWQGQSPLSRLRGKWADYQARRGMREVTVRMKWPDGGVASGSFVSCDGRLVEVGSSGVISCGESKTAMKIIAWTDWYAAAAVAEVPASESELELVVQPKTRPAGE